MIEEYIENQQYKEALTLLNNMDDEKTRYLRLVCLFGLQEYQQAQAEGYEAKIKAQETYYDVVAIYVSILKALEEYEEAINIIIEELSMPYIPYQYEVTYNTAYDELLLAKREAHEGYDSHNHAFSDEDLENVLIKEHPNEDVLYMAIEQMQNMNIRRFLPMIRQFLTNESKPAFAKSLLFELLVEQEVDEEMEIYKDQEMYYLNPSYAPMVLQQEVALEVMELLSHGLEDENPSLFLLCEQFLSFYLYSIFPKSIEEDAFSSLAGAIHYHVSTLQYIEVELEDMELLYQCDKEEILQWVSTFTTIVV